MPESCVRPYLSLRRLRLALLGGGSAGRAAGPGSGADRTDRACLPTARGAAGEARLRGPAPLARCRCRERREKRMSCTCCREEAMGKERVRG